MKIFSTILITLSLVLAFPAVAATPYIGIGMGSDQSSIQYDLKNNAGVQQRYYESDPLEGLNAELFLGYTFHFLNRYALNLQADYRFMDSDFTYTNPQDILNRREYGYSAGSSIGLSVMPGVYLTPQSELYLLLGWVNTRFKRTTDAGIATIFSDGFNQRVSGYRFGVGNEVYLLSHLFLRMQYDYSRYESIDNINIGSTNQAHYVPMSHHFMLGVSYHFSDEVQNKLSAKYPLLMNGFYLGADAQHNTLVMNAEVNSSTVDEHWPRGLNGLTGDVSIGYGAVFHAFYLGAETDFNFGSATYELKRQNGTQRQFTLHKDARWGISLLPGYALNPGNLLFVRVGWVSARFKKTGDTVTSVFIGPNFSERKSGFMTGLGFETSLSDHLGVTLEYDYIDYQSMEQSLNAIDFKYQPTETQFRLGLRYRF